MLHLSRTITASAPAPQLTHRHHVSREAVSGVVDDVMHPSRYKIGPVKGRSRTFENIGSQLRVSPPLPPLPMPPLPPTTAPPLHFSSCGSLRHRYLHPLSALPAPATTQIIHRTAFTRWSTHLLLEDLKPHQKILRRAQANTY